MTFPITIRHDGKTLRFTVELVMADKLIEQYKVHARNGHIVVQSNRPLIRNKGLKHKPPDWKALESHNLSAYVLDKIYKAIEEFVDK